MTPGRWAQAILIASDADESAFELMIERLSNEGSYRQSARRFAAAHGDFDPQKQQEQMLERAHELIGSQNLQFLPNKLI